MPHKKNQSFEGLEAKLFFENAPMNTIVNKSKKTHNCRTNNDRIQIN